MHSDAVDREGDDNAVLCVTDFHPVAKACAVKNTVAQQGLRVLYRPLPSLGDIGENNSGVVFEHRVVAPNVEEVPAHQQPLTAGRPGGHDYPSEASETQTNSEPRGVAADGNREALLLGRKSP